MITAGQGADQHNQGGFRQMEVGDQSIQNLEFVSRIDEDAGFAAAALNNTWGNGSGLKCTAGSGAHCDDAAAVLFSFVNSLSSFFINMIDFTVHHMLFDFVYFYRAEGAKTNVQGHIGNINSFFLKFCQKLTGKMKTGGGGGGRAFLSGIYGLITIAIF